MSNTKTAITARVLSVKLDDWSEDKGGYRYELWIETPYGNLFGKGCPSDCRIYRAVGEIVNCEIVEKAIPPDFDGKKNDMINWYRVL